MNSRGFLVSCAGRPPGWPLVEALFIAALILLALVVVDLIVNFALEFPTP